MTISLITVCYNSASVIRTAMESVLRQTWPEIEYLVIDGGSTDGTVDIIREYEKTFVRSFVCDGVSENADAFADQQIRQSGNKARRQFLWVSEPDRGMYDAINKGVRMATGEVVGILNADDVLADDRVIERVAEVFGKCVNALVPDCVNAGEENCGNALMRECVNEGEENKARWSEAETILTQSESEAVIRHSGIQAVISPGSPDAIYGDIRFVADRRGVGLDELRAERTARYYSARHWRPWMLQWGYMPPHPSVYIRRECFQRLGGYALDYKIAADYALLVRFLRKHAVRCRYVPMCFVDMRVGGMSTRNWRSNLLLNQEIVRGNREAGYFCCLPMLLPKYAFKVWEFAGPRVKRGLARNPQSAMGNNERALTEAQGARRKAETER